MRDPRLALFSVALATLGLAACGDSKPIMVYATSHEIAIQHKPERRPEADRLAAATCADYERRARVRYRHDQHAPVEQFGIYDCLPR